MGKRADATDNGRPTGGSIPFGGLALVAAIAATFLYGIALKASGPGVPAAGSPPPTRGDTPVRFDSGSRASAPAPGARSGSPDRAVPSSREPSTSGASVPEETLSDVFGDTSLDPAAGAQQAPLIPESRSATVTPAPPAGVVPGSKPAPSSARVDAPAMAANRAPSTSPSSTGPLSNSATSPSAAAPANAKTASLPPPAARAKPESSALASNTAPSAGASGSKTPSSAPSRAMASTSPDTPVKTVSLGSTLSTAAVPFTGSQAPRGEAPAAAVRRAKTSLASHDYRSAARAWNDWAWSAPSGSWTVQIAAVRLDRAKAAGSLSSLSNRDGAFVLPAGALGGDLSPVCVGVYPSEEAARRAAAAMPVAPGANRPIAKPLGSLRASR